jgi:ABC-type nitrate/sulfonate/bicarbonate transport system permease component
MAIDKAMAPQKAMRLAASRPAAPSAALRTYFRFEHAILGGLAVVLFLVVWQGFSNGFWADLLQPVLGDASSALRIKPIFISSPTRILSQLGQMAASGEIWDHLYASGVAFAIGGGMAVLIGIPLGLAVGWYRRFRYAVEPFLLAYNATPQVVFIPLVIIWAGTGLFTRVLIIAMIAFIPLTMSAWAAVKTTDPRLLKVAKSFGSSDWQRFRDIILPTSLPFVLSGLRLGIGRAMVGIVVGEVYAATAGIGYLINVSGASFQTDRVFVGILIIALVGLLLTWVIYGVEKRFESWRPRQAKSA